MVEYNNWHEKTIGTSNNMNKSHKHNIDHKKPDIKNNLLCISIFLKLKSKLN